MTQNSNRERIDKLVGRYSSLFTLPSHRNIAICLFTQCLVTGVATVLPLNLSFYGLTVGLSLGILLLSATLLGNYLETQILLRKDPIFNLRRSSFLSLASNMIFSVFAFIASLAWSFRNDPNLWPKVSSLGVFASLTLRFLVLYSVSFMSSLTIFLSVILQPALFLAPLLVIPLLSNVLPIHLLLYFLIAVGAAFLGVHLFIASINTIGTKTLGIPSIRMFRAFLANWTEDLEGPLEEILEQFSEEREVKVSMIAFRTGERLKAVIVVPGIHPGPFKNVGSSPIPSLIQEALEKKLGCVVSVPHGISGHELDLSSQHQNKKVLDRVSEASEFDVFQPCATQSLSLKKGSVTVGCQIFGDCALLTLTLAPETMEDLPLELDDIIIQEAKRKGLAWAVAIDAHNSLQGPFNAEKVISPIKEAVVCLLERAASLGQSGLGVGAAKLTARDFGIREGIGPGGISVVITRVGDQKTAYITIDGNNMVSGLREKILSSLEELGVDGGEVLTTDTHIVNAVVMADRGYHPIGETIDHDLLIDCIRTAVTEALGNLEPTEVSWRQENIKGVKIIGEHQIDSLCLMVDGGAKKAKKMSALVFPAIGIFLTILIIFL